jgi:hypothetical protein
MMRKKYFLREADEMDKEAVLKSAEESLEQEKQNLENNKKSLEVNKETLKASEVDVDTKLSAIQGNNKVIAQGNKAEDVTDPKTQADALTRQKPVLTKQVNGLKQQNKEKEQAIKNQEESIKNQEDYIKQKEDYIKDMESGMRESRIIKAKDFKSIVENYSKIDLSESDIINIIVETQNPIMTKAKIVESIQNKLIFEADMNRDVNSSFEGGTNEYSELLGSDLAKQMANQSFEEIARAIRQKTGKERVTFDDVQQLMSSSLMNAAKEEYAYGIDRLETKAVEMIRKQFNIPEGAVEFDATITGVPQKALGLPSGTPQATINQMSRQLGVKIGDIQREGLKFDKGTSPVPQGKTEVQMKPKIKRRKYTNAMMHGAARKSQNIHHMDDQLRQENPRLSQNYANLMAANDASYWMMNDEDIKTQGRQGIHAGNVRVKLSDQPNGVPKIIAQGVVFPVLLHELAKGVIELMSLWSLPVDAEERKYVLDKTDNLDNETNDIRLGTIFWEKFVRQIPTDNQEVISLTWNMMQELSDDEFNSIIEGLSNDRTDSQMKVQRIAEEAAEELRREASDDTFGMYGDNDDNDKDGGDVETPDEDEEETNPTVLGGEKEGPEEPKDLNDMTDDELRGLMKSAIEDEDYEFASEIRDILKNR